MLFNETMSNMRSQLKQQADNSIRVEHVDVVPPGGPSHRGLWWKISDVAAVFVDIKGSTKLVSGADPRDVAEVYTYFVRAMTIIFNEFGALYIDIQGDGLFGLFSGPNSLFSALACAVTMNTAVQSELRQYIKKSPIPPWRLSVGIGVDREEVLVRRLGLRRVEENEVWSGKPVNMASKLSSRASYNQILISDRVHKALNSASGNRRSAALYDCSKCKAGASKESIWRPEKPSPKRGFDFKTIYRSNMTWCPKHAGEICEAVVNGRRPGG